MYKVCPTSVSFISESMKLWKTTLDLHHSSGSMTSRPIKSKCGIFQGDSLSPLLFCIALAPLSSLLNESTYGYEILGGKINHLFYMDDLKTFAKNDDQLTGFLTIVKTFRDDIPMEFGLEKCAKATFKRGRLKNTRNLDLDTTTTTIKELEQEGTYKYLGVNEGDGIQHAAMKEKIRKEYCRRTRFILKSELNAINRIEAINILAMPVLTYSFNIINWKLSEIKKLDTKTRKLLTMANMHHPKVDIDRLYLPRSDGGQGLVQLELTYMYKTTTIGLDAYLRSSNDRLLHLVQRHDKKKKLYPIQREAEKYKQELDLQETSPTCDERAVLQAKKIKATAKHQGQQQLQKRWEEKAMHGRYPLRIREADLDLKLTNQWIKWSGLKLETEGQITAAQDQALLTKTYQHDIIKYGTDPQLPPL